MSIFILLLTILFAVSSISPILAASMDADGLVILPE